MTDTDLVNNALTLIGEDSISSLDNTINSKVVSAATVFLPIVKRAVLRAHDWNCARARAVLTPIANDSMGEWSHAYRLPPDCLAVRRFVNDISRDQNRPFAVELGADEKHILYCNVQAARIIYTRDLLDVSRWDALLFNAAKYRLAIDFASVFPRDLKFVSAMSQLFNAAIEEARGVNEAEGGIERVYSDSLTMARYGDNWGGWGGGFGGGGETSTPETPPIPVTPPAVPPPVTIFGGVFPVVQYDSIQDAIDAAEASGTGGIVLLPPGSININNTLRVSKSNIFLRGMGKGHQHDQSPLVPDYSTRLVWTGTNGGTMLEIAPVEGASARRISGGGVTGIGFYGMGLGGIAVLIKSVNNGLFDIYGEDLTDVVVRMDVATTLGEARDAQHNIVSVYGKQVEAGAGKVLELTGDSTANASFNVFPVVYGLYKNSTAVNLLNSDNNVFITTRLFRFGGGAAIGVVSNGAASASLAARANRWLMLSPGEGGITIKGTSSFTVASTRNVIDTYDVDNMAPTPVLETNATLVIGDYDGRQTITDVGWERLSALILRFLGGAGFNKELLRLIFAETGDSVIALSHGVGAVSIEAGGGTGADVAMGISTKGSGQGDLYGNHFGTRAFSWSAVGVGFNGTNPVTKPTITGAKGSNAALGSLLAALASMGLIIDSSSA